LGIIIGEVGLRGVRMVIILDGFFLGKIDVEGVGSKMMIMV
jgi:hypothetical protein